MSKFGAEFQGLLPALFLFSLTTSSRTFCNDERVISEVSKISQPWELPGYEPDSVHGGLEDSEERREHSY